MKQFGMLLGLGLLFPFCTAKAEGFETAGECTAKFKVYCSCETLTHPSFYGISLVKLNLENGERTVITKLKNYFDEPVYRVQNRDDLLNCKVQMKRYDECNMEM